MRFNPKARLDASRVGDGGGGGGGGPMRIPLPGGTRAGGGIGGLIIIVLFIILTQCMGGGRIHAEPGRRHLVRHRHEPDRTTASATRTARRAPTPTPTRTARASASRTRWSHYWEKTLPEQSNTAVRARLDRRPSAAPCRPVAGRPPRRSARSTARPTRRIYLDTTFFDDVLEGQLGGQGGDFVEAYVLAHEYGHHIQNLLGTMGQVRTQKGPESDAVRLELQADCYAGMWTKDASDGDSLLEGLDEGDINEAVDSAKTVGDDRIQQKSGQGVDPEGWTHGSSEQRMAWFMKGYTDGTLEACDTFSASEL